MKNLILFTCFKSLFLLLSLSTPVLVSAKVTAKWFGITSVVISDSKTSILFDPVVTRPSLWDVIFFKKITSDEGLVKEWIEKLSIKKAEAIFISHSHADHSLDVASFAKMTGAKIFGSETTLNIARGFNASEINLIPFRANQVYEIGDFKIKVLPSRHSPIIFDLQMFDGELKKPLQLPASYASFKMGGAFNFHITHPEGNILFHPGARAHEDLTDYSALSADIIFQGVSSRRSTQDQFDTIIKKVKPQKIYPIHYDDFFKPLSEGIKFLRFVKAEEYIDEMNKLSPNILHLPKLGEELVLFEGEK